MTHPRTYCTFRSAAGASSTTAQKQQQRATKAKQNKIKKISKQIKTKTKTKTKQQTTKAKTNKTLTGIHDTLAHLLYTQKRSMSQQYDSAKATVAHNKIKNNKIKQINK